MRENIIKYLSNFDLDVRKSQDARFMDQKCTPDVVCFIADCIINTVDVDNEFTVSNIWDAQYFIKNARAIFNKPLPTNPKARHEYDKFIQQPPPNACLFPCIGDRKTFGNKLLSRC